MANKIYPKYKAACMGGGPNVNLLTGSIKTIMASTSAYTYSDAHEFLADVPSGARVATSGDLAAKSVGIDGSFKSGNGRCNGVTGITVSAIILYVDSGADSTSRLVAYFDTGITGLPVTPAGASYNIIPDATGWFIE